MLKPGSVFFLCAMVATATVYNMWLRGQVVERQAENAALKATVQANESALHQLRAEIARRDTIIAERDHRIALAEKRLRRSWANWRGCRMRILSLLPGVAWLCLTMC